MYYIYIFIYNIFNNIYNHNGRGTTEIYIYIYIYICTCLRSPYAYGLRSHGVYLGRTGYIYIYIYIYVYYKYIYTATIHPDIYIYIYIYIYIRLSTNHIAKCICPLQVIGVVNRMDVFYYIY